MTEKINKISEEKLKELKIELKDCVSKRSEITEAIATAREFGDLKENSDYSSARDLQAINESRIEEIESILENYEIIDEDKKFSKAAIGAEVVIESGKITKNYEIVGSLEADPISGRISDESPIGKELIGKSVGDSITIGSNKFIIKKIS
jgi:transcription elongation factor GreA